MPYIPKSERTLASINPQNAGQLNYAITVLINNYWKERKRYQAVNDIIGALEGAKLEFYRRIVSNYENNKIIDNGDVYEEKSK